MSETYHLPSPAGRARVVLGNRRWGENGSVKNGKMYARPVHSSSTANGAGPSSSSSGSSPPVYSKGVGKAGNGRGGPNSQHRQHQQQAGGSCAPKPASVPVHGFETAPGSAPAVGEAGSAVTLTTPLGGGRAGGSSPKASTPISIRPGGRNAAAAGENDVAGSGGSPAAGSSVGKGRRAKRNERRAAGGEEVAA